MAFFAVHLDITFYLVNYCQGLIESYLKIIHKMLHSRTQTSFWKEKNYEEVKCMYFKIILKVKESKYAICTTAHISEIYFSIII